MILLLVLLPFVTGAIAFWTPWNSLRRFLLLSTAVVHTSLVGYAWTLPRMQVYHGWFALDDLGIYFLTLTSVLFLISSVYAVGYLSRGGHDDPDYVEGLLFSRTPEAVFTACLLFFLATMTLVTISQHFGMLWVAIEATTLASAPLIYFHRHHRSLEATWKYLLICSVGIALALLGNFLVAASSQGQGGIDLTLESLRQNATFLNAAWLKAGLILLVVGYGTKMGLAPMHTWLPDAHSESPSVVSALLSGVLLNCAFIGILRIYQVCVAAGLGSFAQGLLVGFGLLSMFVAAVFIIGQTDYKRMLAYSSVEHMGVLALGVGIGGAGTFGAMLHAVNHSFAKALLFLTAGNILAIYKTKSSDDVRGVVRLVPLTGVLWIIGFLAITGSPPFGAFVSEFVILKAALDAHRPWVAAGYVLALGLIFVGMATVFLRMAQGSAPEALCSSDKRRESWLSIAPPAVLAVMSLSLGIYLPTALSHVLSQVSHALGGQ